MLGLAQGAVGSQCAPFRPIHQASPKIMQQLVHCSRYHWCHPSLIAVAGLSWRRMGRDKGLRHCGGQCGAAVQAGAVLTSHEWACKSTTPTDANRDLFEEGFVHLPATFPAGDAQELLAQLWQDYEARFGVARTDSRRWTTEGGHDLRLYGPPPKSMVKSEAYKSVV
eukprot:677306-Amphidinium_carterae.1